MPYPSTSPFKLQAMRGGRALGRPRPATAHPCVQSESESESESRALRPPCAGGVCPFCGRKKGQITRTRNKNLEENRAAFNLR